MFFKVNKKDNNNDTFIKVAALLIHAAKIDENYMPPELKDINLEASN